MFISLSLKSKDNWPRINPGLLSLNYFRLYGLNDFTKIVVIIVNNLACF